MGWAQDGTSFVWEYSTPTGTAAVKINANFGTLKDHINAGSAHGATAANTADAIVKRDGSGNFNAGTLGVVGLIGIGSDPIAVSSDLVSSAGVEAGSFTLGGDTITDWPSGGGASSSGTGLQAGDGSGGLVEVTGSSVSGGSVQIGGRLILPNGDSTSAGLAFATDPDNAYVRWRSFDGIMAYRAAGGHAFRVFYGDSLNLQYDCTASFPSDLSVGGRLSVTGTLKPGTIATGSTPGTVSGQLCIDTSTGHLNRWDGSAWQDLG